MRKLFLIGINTIKGFAGPFFNFLIAAFGIRLYGKENWGELINVIIYVSLLTFILNWGNKEFLLRKYSEKSSLLIRIFSINFFSRTIIFPLSFILILFFPLNIALLSIVLVFIIHAFSSLNSLVIYHQKFTAQLLAEIIGFLIIIGGFYFYIEFEVILFIQLYILANLLKLIIIFLSLKINYKELTFKIDLDDIKFGFPFFLVGFSGWINSKIDLYLVSYKLSRAELSEYQLLITSFLMLQAIPAFFVTPFMKHVFRMKSENLANIERILRVVAIPIVVLGTFFIYLILESVVQLNIEYHIYILAAIASIPSFLFIIRIIKFYKQKREKEVMYINFICAFINLILILALISTLQLRGVFIAICITQWINLLLYMKYDQNKLPGV